MEDIKVILISKFPLPYVGIASWTTMMNYHLEHSNHIDVIICPKSTVRIENTARFFVSDRTLMQKAFHKLGFGSKHSNYIKAFSKQVKLHKKIIVQIVDDYGLLLQVLNFIKANKLRKRVYVQFFYHGFSTFTTSENIFSQIDELILLSNASYKSFKQNCRSLPVKTNINNNGINSDLFYPVSESKKLQLRETYGFDKEKIIFVWCSQDREKKGLDIAIQAWKRLVDKYTNEIELLVIGTEKEIKLKNVRVIGRVSNHKLAEYYQLSDFYLFTTLCHEGFGLSLAEALKCGAYCIASNNGAVSEVLQDGNYGTLVENPNNVQSWVQIIDKELVRYKSIGRKNPFSETIPEKLYEITEWHNNSNAIVASAKENFSNRYYL